MDGGRFFVGFASISMEGVVGSNLSKPAGLRCLRKVVVIENKVGRQGVHLRQKNVVV